MDHIEVMLMVELQSGVCKGSSVVFDRWIQGWRRHRGSDFEAGVCSKFWALEC